METKFLWPIISSIFSSQPYSSNNNNLLFPQFPTFLSISLSIYFILLQIIAMILLLIQLFKSTVLLPLIIIHLLLICSIMFQLLQLLTEGHPTTELFVWFWLVIRFIKAGLWLIMIWIGMQSDFWFLNFQDFMIEWKNLTWKFSPKMFLKSPQIEYGSHNYWLGLLIINIEHWTILKV